MALSREVMTELTLEPVARPAMGGGQRQRAPGLDGVRALAVLAVLAFHLGIPAAPGGFLGVDVFFVLSGYLITDLLAARRDRLGKLHLGQFWAGGRGGSCPRWRWYWSR